MFVVGVVQGACPLHGLGIWMLSQSIKNTSFTFGLNQYCLTAACAAVLVASAAG